MHGRDGVLLVQKSMDTSQYFQSTMIFLSLKSHNCDISKIVMVENCNHKSFRLHFLDKSENYNYNLTLLLFSMFQLSKIQFETILRSFLMNDPQELRSLLFDSILLYFLKLLFCLLIGNI